MAGPPDCATRGEDRHTAARALPSFPRRKFAPALAGLAVAFRTETSLWIHALAAVLALGACFFFQVSAAEFCAVLLAITLVISLELANTAVENVVRVVARGHDPSLGRALDTMAAAVLLAAMGAVCVGVVVFLPPLADLVLGAGWWQGKF